MNSLNDTALESNTYLRINFDGGDLSSDAGLLLIKEFAEKIGLVKLVYRLFKTNIGQSIRHYRYTSGETAASRRPNYTGYVRIMTANMPYALRSTAL